LPDLADSELILGQGATPLLYDAVLAEQRRRGRPLSVAYARVGWGIVPALLAALGANPLPVATCGPEYLLAPQALPDKFDLLLLANPTNPSGASYAGEALSDLVRAAAQRGARVVIDEVFGLLSNLGADAPPRADRFSGLALHEQQQMLIVAGLSKEFAAGGLRVAFAASRDKDWLHCIAALQLSHLSLHAQVGAEAVLSYYAEDARELIEMRQVLRGRRRRLAEGLAALGLSSQGAERGGLFLWLEPRLPPDADIDAFVLDLEQRARVRLNTPAWAGAQRHIRACFALPESAIDQALARLGAVLPPRTG
jgi:aspartate/methionine/tyrosine aminotransferase